MLPVGRGVAGAREEAAVAPVVVPPALPVVALAEGTGTTSCVTDGVDEAAPADCAVPASAVGVTLAQPANPAPAAAVTNTTKARE
jgi:hypothetical protein